MRLELNFADHDRFDLVPAQALLLAGALRAHAALAVRGLTWEPEPTALPSKVRHENPPRGGWVQCWTPWPPSAEPTVRLIGGEHAVLTFDQAVAVAAALEEAAG